MASNKAEKARVLFSEAIKVDKLDSHTYRANLNEAFCIGKVPNGGYTASCMLAAARTHLIPRGQPDTLTAHFEYPGRTAVGPAIVTIEDVKMGRQLSTLHLALWQGDGLLAEAPWVTPGVSRRAVLAYANLTDLGSFAGMTVPTGYESTSAARLPDPLPDFGALITYGGDNFWEEPALPRGSEFHRSLRNWRLFLPRSGPMSPGVLDMWIRLASSERITQAALAYVADSFPFNLHMYLAAPGPRGDAHGDKTRRHEARRAGLWMPTVVMNLEAKTALAEEGVEWLAVRITAKQIRDGKFDLDVLVRDVEGEIIALSHHVAMILSIERNTGERRSSAKAAL